MARPLAVSKLFAILLLIVSRTCFATSPLIVAELDSQIAISQADWDRAAAEHASADWKLTRLEQLKAGGHASWQEVAEQQVAVAALAARELAAQQYFEAVVDWQTRLAKVQQSEPFADYECIRLFMPGTARLVAWMATDVASVELVKQHLEDLGKQHQAALAIDLSTFETELDSARQSVEALRRNSQDSHLLDHARIRLRLAVANYESAKASKAAADILVRRMVLARDSLRAHRDDRTDDNTGPTSANSSSLAQVGTRFVDASGDRELSQLVNSMAGDQSVVGQRLELLCHQQQAAAETVDALKKLLQHNHARPDELARAEQQRNDVEKQIQQIQQTMRQQEKLAEHYQYRLPSRPITPADESALDTIDKQIARDANVIRHRLEMTRRMLRAVARRSATDARHQYLVEKMKRITRIPQRLRAPKELRHIRHKVQAAKLQQAVVDSEIVAFEQEERRFKRQLQSQSNELYQLVQDDNGQFIGRRQFELAQMWIAVVGFVGQADCCNRWPGIHPYIESAMLFDCSSQLSASSAIFTPSLIRNCDWRSETVLLRRAEVSSLQSTTDWTWRFGLVSDWLSNPRDSVCFSHYRLRQYDLRYPWEPRAYLAVPDYQGNRFWSYYPYACRDLYAGCPSGYWRSSVLSYQVGGRPRSTFPYRSSYLFWSNFPTRSILYASPYASPSTSFSGLGYTRWLNSSCFD